MKPEPTYDEPESTPDENKGNTSNKENTPIFNINEATKDATIVENSENPYYEGIWTLT